MIELLPPNASAFEKALAGATSRLADVPVPLDRLWNPSTCPLEWLPFLAWALSLDSWSADWPEAVKRERVRQAITIQRRKGTARSVRDVVRSFGGQVGVREWWQMTPPGNPHSFGLVLTLSGTGGATATAAYVDAVIAEVERTKPVRSRFTFTQGISLGRPVGVVGTVRPALYTRLRFTVPAAPPVLFEALDAEDGFGLTAEDGAILALE